MYESAPFAHELRYSVVANFWITALEHELTDLDTSETPSDRYAVPALERGLLLLCEFSRNDRTLTAPELARRLSIPRSTVFRLLTTLERMGFVRKVESGSAYRLDMGVLRLGFEYLASLELTELGGPLLEKLRDATGLPSNLVVRDGQSVVYRWQGAYFEPVAVKLGRVSPGRVAIEAGVNEGDRLALHDPTARVL